MLKRSFSSLMFLVIAVSLGLGISSYWIVSAGF